MTQGLNLKATLWRMNTTTDDVVGGAMITGTPVYSNLPIAIAAKRPTQASLEQGLEVDAIYDLTARQCNVTIYERDEVEVTCPANHPYYGLRFRVLGTQPPKRYRQGAQHCTLSRVRQSRRQQ